MTRSRPITFLLSAAVLPLSALAIAACGGGSAATASPAPTTSTSHPTSTKPPPAAVRVADSSLGKILVNSQGRSLYLFKADAGTKSACTGACATAWPPLLAKGNPTAGSGANASLVGATTRSDGSRQVTYNGHPLYLFIKDTKPGQTNGQGVIAFGAAWLVLSPAGNQISSHPTGHRGSSSPKQAAPPAAQPKPPVSNPIPQNHGGDNDADNNGGPSDGDGNI
jgi:predicted lipoprotein with Yx(FWY)xxD motif